MRLSALIFLMMISRTFAVEYTELTEPHSYQEEEDVIIENKQEQTEDNQPDKFLPKDEVDALNDALHPDASKEMP